MQPLLHSFMVFECIGVWRPVHWCPGWKTIAYDLYTCLMIFMVYTCTISEFVDLIGSFNNAEEFANASFMLLTMIGVCGKAANLLKKRSVIIELMNVLQNDICRPRGVEEIQIQSKYDRGASYAGFDTVTQRFNTLWYGALTGMASVSISVRSLILDIPQRALPYRAWVPYNYDTNQIGFWFAYFHLLVAPAVGALVNIGFDTLVPGLLMQICAQIKILQSRISAIPKTIDTRRKSRYNENDDDSQKESRILESELLTECIRHHLEIYQLAKTSNEVFGLVVFLQYSVSSVVICVSVYELTKVKLFSTAFAGSVLYLACMLAQIYIYCFYGGETTLQSMEICDAVYSMDWSLFGVKTNRSLLTIMIRSQRSITFTCGSIVTLSLETFSKLIKLSYSTYSVLQQSGE